MNLNPFMYYYKNYPNSKIATMVSRFCGGMQRVFIIFAVLIMIVAIFENVANFWESLIGCVVCLILWLMLKLNKNRWCDKIAAKQEVIDSQQKNK